MARYRFTSPAQAAEARRANAAKVFARHAEDARKVAAYDDLLAAAEATLESLTMHGGECQSGCIYPNDVCQGDAYKFLIAVIARAKGQEAGDVH